MFKNDVFIGVIVKISQRWYFYKCQDWQFCKNSLIETFRDDAFRSVIVNINQRQHLLEVS